MRLIDKRKPRGICRLHDCERHVQESSDQVAGNGEVDICNGPVSNQVYSSFAQLECFSDWGGTNQRLGVESLPDHHAPNRAGNDQGDDCHDCARSSPFALPSLLHDSLRLRLATTDLALVCLFNETEENRVLRGHPSRHRFRHSDQHRAKERMTLTSAASNNGSITEKLGPAREDSGQERPENIGCQKF